MVRCWSGKTRGERTLSPHYIDPGHEDFMPTDGKTPLTKSETEMIRWWIENADASEGRKLLDLKGYEKMTPLVASLLKLPGARPLPETESQQCVW